MHRRGYTVIVVPPEGRRTRTLRVSGLLISICFILVCGLGAAGVYLGQEYTRLVNSYPDTSQLERDNLAYRSQILAFSEKIRALRSEMELLGQSNQKLRLALSSIHNKNGQVWTGQGGSVSEAETGPTADLRRNRQELIREMHQDLERLAERADMAEQIQQELQSSLETRKSILASTPSIWPAKGWVTSPFGWRRSPFSSRRELHKGMDIANRSGTPIKAPAAGVVAKVGWENGYGRVVVLHHGYGLTTKYAHLRKANVKPGQLIKRNQVIAKMGSSGRSTGSHLHYEVWLNGVPVNPTKYMVK